ncbi:hypothetical protein, partial [Escherichia coli]|uniref:hypothetical protein n=1 Tax=Escherichia coli TaxID=562 RepID=UPI00201D0723
STIVSVVTLVWGISPRQPSGKNIIRWLLKKRTNGSVRYCQYTSHVNHEWSVMRDDWDDLVDDFFRRILIETLKYCKRKRSKFCGT